jgi:hypothetical protein
MVTRLDRASRSTRDFLSTLATIAILRSYVHTDSRRVASSIRTNGFDRCRVCPQGRTGFGAQTETWRDPVLENIEYGGSGRRCQAVSLIMPVAVAVIVVIFIKSP